jgi:hypothetical protein
VGVLQEPASAGGEPSAFGTSGPPASPVPPPPVPADPSLLGLPPAPELPPAPALPPAEELPPVAEYPPVTEPPPPAEFPPVAALPPLPMAPPLTDAPPFAEVSPASRPLGATSSPAQPTTRAKATGKVRNSIVVKWLSFTPASVPGSVAFAKRAPKKSPDLGAPLHLQVAASANTADSVAGAHVAVVRAAAAEVDDSIKQDVSGQ